MSTHRVHPGLLARLRTLRSDQPVRVIVEYEPTAVAPHVAARRWRPLRVARVLPFMTLELPAAQVEELAQEPYVKRVWEDLPVYPLLDVSVPKIGAPRVWELGWTGEGIRVAVVDTGVDLHHPDLEDRIVATADFSGSGSVQDRDGHGTHVASIIAGSGAASGGTYRGVAPEAELYIAKALDDRGRGYMSDVIAGLDWALAQQVHVVNVSLGAEVACDGTDALSTACDALVKEGIVVCVAAGNSGPGRGTIGSPGCAREVITVGATTDNDQVALFSSRGPTADGRVKPDICFPGEGIVAARAQGTDMGTPVNTYYTAASGTSMATPHCTGAVALLLEAEPHLTPSDIKKRLMDTAVDLGLDANLQGAGRGDVYAAVAQAPVTKAPETDISTPEPPSPPTPEPTPPPPPEPTPPGPPSRQPAGCLLGLLLGLFGR
ncbi:MAG: S8 family peptidase [Chloroflexi bacterium]|nr:S8 family peptidase [Chloroflexota bacterium]